MCVCECVRACLHVYGSVRACLRACVCACVRGVCGSVQNEGDWLAYLRQECCYTWSGSLVSTEDGRGGQTFFYHPRYVRQHEKYDVLPKQWCCQFTDNCQYFYHVRPMDHCWGYTPLYIGRYPRPDTQIWQHPAKHSGALSSSSGVVSIVRVGDRDPQFPTCIVTVPLYSILAKLLDQ